MNRRNFIAALASVPFISKAKPTDKITVSINEPSKLTSVKLHQGVYELMVKQNKVLLLKGDE